MPGADVTLTVNVDTSQAEDRIAQIDAVLASLGYDVDLTGEVDELTPPGQG